MLQKWLIACAVLLGLSCMAVLSLFGYVVCSAITAQPRKCVGMAAFIDHSSLLGSIEYYRVFEDGAIEFVKFRKGQEQWMTDLPKFVGRSWALEIVEPALRDIERDLSSMQLDLSSVESDTSAMRYSLDSIHGHLRTGTTGITVHY